MSKGRSDFLVLAVDMGSSSTRTAIFDQDARRLPQTDAAEHYSIRYTADGGAELSPIILRRAVARCIATTLHAQRQTRRGPHAPVAALAASSFWHGLLGLDRKWKPITPIYTWADARAAEAARQLRKNLSEREVHARTGCMLHASFWPAKLIWLRKSQPNLFRQVARWVSPVDWVFHELFGTTVSSASMASGTGLYNLRLTAWDKKLCAACHLHPNQLLDLSTWTDANPAGRHLRVPSRIFTPIGDGAAGNLGSGADCQGVFAINVGTSAAVRVVQSNGGRTSQKLPLGLFRYVVDAERCVIGGAVSNAGNLRQWALAELRLGEDASADRLIFARPAAATDKLIALPFWAGERAPTWPDRQLGVIDGLSQTTKATDILRVLTTSVFYRLAQILELMVSGEGLPERIIVSGGIVRSNPAVRLLADAIGHDVETAREREASRRGAAVYALQQMGVTLQRPRAGAVIKHDRKLAAGHRARRARQIELESLLRERVSRPL